MGKKLKLIPFLFKTLSSDSPPSWPWPSCSNQPKTLSFRAAAVPDIFKTANTVFSVEESSSGDDETAVLSGLRAKDRLFFEPGQTSSILESPLPPQQRKKKKEVTPETAETAEMDSMDPVTDFRRSMEEMVEAHGMKDWDGLEELLGWYLSVNVKSNHGYIVGAFVDLIIGICSSEEEDEEELSESLSRSCSSLLSRSDEGDHDHHHHLHHHHHQHKVHNHNSMSTSISSHSPTSALSFSSSSTSSCSILPSSLQALLEADDVDQQKIKNLNPSS